MSIVQISTFPINFDLPPEERYLEIWVNLGEKIKATFLKFFDFIPSKRKDIFKKLTVLLENTDPDYHAEISSLASMINLPVWKCVAVDHCCEATTGCTSVLAKMVDEEGRGKVVHGRNLDYPVDVELMREVLVKAVYYKGGKEVCTSKWAIWWEGF